MQIKMIWSNNIVEFEETVNEFISRSSVSEVLSIDYATYPEGDSIEYSAMIVYV